MQTELLNRQRWKTRMANAIFDYPEVFHNRQRRHSALGMRTMLEFELLHRTIQPVARNPAKRRQQARGISKCPGNRGLLVS